jgi:hypothetical protein
VLTATGSKVRGSLIVDLDWNDTALSVDVYRDGEKIITNIAGGSYTDSSLDKGGGTYTYQICDTEDSLNCSNTATVVF